MPPPLPGRIFVHQSGLEPPDPEPGDTPERSGAQSSGSDLRASKPAMSRWSMWECLTIRLGPARVEASDVKVVHVGMPHNQSDTCSVCLQAHLDVAAAKIEVSTQRSRSRALPSSARVGCRPLTMRWHSSLYAARLPSVGVHPRILFGFGGKRTPTPWPS